MKRFLKFAVILLAGAATADPGDFARGRIIDTADGSVVQRLTVPADVYQWVTRADLGDLRVFNDGQDAVPYAIRRPQSTEEYSPWKTYPLFPLPDGELSNSRDTQVRVAVDATGTVVSVSGEPSLNLPAAGFLVDASALARPASELRVDWEGQDDGDFVGKLRIEASEDLDEWQTLVASTTIAGLSSSGHDVRTDRVNLPRTSARYLRITQLEGSDRIRLSQVQLRHRESQLPLRQWHEVEGVAREDGFEFATGGLFPIDRIQLIRSGSTDNYLVSVVLHSRSTPDDKWRQRATHTFYRTTINGLTLEADPVRVNDRHQYWRVEVDSGELAAPVLRFGWLPDELVFLRQGSAPYVLAYGQAGGEGQPWPLKRLLSQLNGDAGQLTLADIPSARAGEAQMLGGPARLEPPAEPIHWRTIVLWAVLLLGVAVVGGFAYRLLKA